MDITVRIVFIVISCIQIAIICTFSESVMVILKFHLHSVSYYFILLYYVNMYSNETSLSSLAERGLKSIIKTGVGNKYINFLEN